MTCLTELRWQFAGVHDVRAESLVSARTLIEATGLGDLAVYEGRFADGAQLLEQGAAADLAAKSPDRAAVKFAAIAHAQLARGQMRPAAAAAERALANSRTPRRSSSSSMRRLSFDFGIPRARPAGAKPRCSTTDAK